MHKLLLAGLAAGVLTLGAPAASASHDMIGGCGLVPLTDAVAGEGQLTSVLYAAGYVVSPDPVSVVITCYVVVNGVPQPGAAVTASGNPYVGGSVVTYTAHPLDHVQLCQVVTSYSSQGAHTTQECFEPDELELPPPIVWDVVDPIACLALATASGVYGPVYVDDEGDVYVFGEPKYDCPPYDMGGPGIGFTGSGYAR